jgi:hypothetical protein
MSKRFKMALIALAGAAVLAGCTHMSTRTLPKADIGKYKRVWVEQRLADNYGIAEEIARQLREMGYDSSAGALTMMPGETELIVSYEDLWTWDFNTYMIEIDMQVRSAKTDKILAVGHYNRPSMVFGRPPESMIHDLLERLFKKG